MLTRKQMERELIKRYGTNVIWFVDWNWNCEIQDLSNKEIADIYNKKDGQYKDFKILSSKDLRRQRWTDRMIIITKRDFMEETYYEHQWDPSFNKTGFSNGHVLNSYKDSGDIIRISEGTVVERIDGEFFIQENYHACPTGHVFE